MDDFGGIFGIIAFVCGIYFMYAFFSMKKTGEIRKAILLGKDVDTKKCKDTKAYLQYVTPKVLLMGIATTIYGIAELVGTYVVVLPLQVVWACYGLFFIVLIWYGFSATRAAKKYF